MKTEIGKNQILKIIAIFLVMSFILAGGGLLAATRFGDEVVTPVLMFFFALCFSIIIAWSKKNKWAIIPAGFFTSVGLVTTFEILYPQSDVIGVYRFQVLVPKMDILIPQSEVTGLIFMLLMAATFLAFTISSKKNWWAIIPAGAFASIGLVIALENLIPHEEYPQIQGMLTWGFYTWVLFLGLAATFGILWLLRKTQPTSWAIYPAVGFLAMAVLFIIEGARFTEYWLVTALLVIVVTLLLAVLSGKKPAAGQQVPKINV